MTALTIDVGPGIGRVLQDRMDGLVTGTHPDDLRPAVGMPTATGDLQPMVVEEVQHRRRRAQPLELRKDGPDRSLDLLIGIEFDLAIPAPDVAGRETQRQLSAPGLAHAGT